MARPKTLTPNRYYAQVVFCPLSADEPNSEEALLELSAELSHSGERCWEIDRFIIMPAQVSYRTGIKGHNCLVLWKQPMSLQDGKAKEFEQ